MTTQPHIRAERLRRRLTELVRVPSLTGDEGAAIARVRSWLDEVAAAAPAKATVESWVTPMAELERDPAYPGREVERDDVPVVAARLDGPEPGPTLLLTGHVDVVPIGDRAQWSRDPFGAERDGDRLYGRGACDMKAGVIAALEAWTAIAEAGGPRAGSLLFVAVPGEEDGGTGTLAAIRRGWGADMAIVTEPTAAGGEPPQVIVAHGGALTFTLTVSGRSAHACKRLEGVSALERYWALHTAMRRAEADLNERESDPLLRALGLPYPTCVGRVEGGWWSSSVMDHLRAEIRVGVAVGEGTEAAEARFRRTIAEAAAADPWLRDHPPQVERTGAAFASARIDPGHPLVAHVRGAAADVFGAAPPLAAAPYGCDMAMWCGPGGTPTLVYGPGDVTLAHAPDEWVSLAQTEQVAQVLLTVASRALRPGGDP